MATEESSLFPGSVVSDLEGDDLMSNFNSETTYHDHNDNDSTLLEKPEWSFSCYKLDGKMHILGEWKAKTKTYRYAVIGPDWPCVILTYAFIITPSAFVYMYILENLAEEIIFFILFGVSIFGLTTVFLADPGLVRAYHHARSRLWTYCDHCDSFRPPNSVHCSTCQVCIAGYDHHCPWTGKCIGFGNLYYFKLFIFSLALLILYVIILAILFAFKVGQ